MKVQVLGFERSEGISEKSGTPKPYKMASLHTSCALEQRMEDDPAKGKSALAKGYMGTTYSVGVDVIRRIEHLSPPFTAELIIEDRIRFGKRESNVTDIKPIARGDKPVATA